MTKTEKEYFQNTGFTFDELLFIALFEMGEIIPTKESQIELLDRAEEEGIIKPSKPLSHEEAERILQRCLEKVRNEKSN